MTIWGQRSGTCSFAKCKQTVPKAKDSVPTAAWTKGEGQCPDCCTLSLTETVSSALSSSRTGPGGLRSVAVTRRGPPVKDSVRTAAWTKGEGQCPDCCTLSLTETVSSALSSSRTGPGGLRSVAVTRRGPPVLRQQHTATPRAEQAAATLPKAVVRALPAHCEPVWPSGKALGW